MSKYVIERQLYGVDNWENWEDENPTIYDNYMQALNEVREFIADCKVAFQLGHMDGYPSFKEFRIKKIG